MSIEKRAPAGLQPAEAHNTPAFQPEPNHSTTQPRATQVTRVALRYRAFTSCAPAPRRRDDVGITDFVVSVQGKPYRPPRNGDDLHEAHSWLQSNGFTLVQTDRRGGRGNVHPALYTEAWSLHPIPDPPGQPQPPDELDDYQSWAARRRVERLAEQAQARRDQLADEGEAMQLFLIQTDEARLSR